MNPACKAFVECIRIRLALCNLLILVGTVLVAPAASAIESKSFVVGWFSNAAHSQDGDCPDGINPDIGEQFRRNLVLLGYSTDEANELVRNWIERGDRSRELVDLMTYRGRIDGKPVNAYAHPEAVIDPQLNAVQSEVAWGFNLNGKVEPYSFRHPETGEDGIDHQLFRALGCIQQYRGTIKNDPTYWTWAWTMMKDSMPAWIITISGDSLTQDGDVSVSFERALEHVHFVPTGGPRAHMTFRKDPDIRWQNVFEGHLKNGVVTIAEPSELRLLKDPLSFPELNLSSFHFRLELKEDDSLAGLIGGYQPWEEIFFAFGQTSFGGETMVTGDIPGMYYLLKNHADSDPDPVTGQNRAISVAYRIEAVPAFLVSPSESHVVASKHQ